MSTPIKNIRAERIVGELDATEISISGSLSGLFSGSFTGSLEGTASFAQTASFVPGYISGTGTTGQVSFFDGTTTQTGDNGLFWDNTNKRLGVGTTTPSQSLHVNGNIWVQSSADSVNAIVVSNSGFIAFANTSNVIGSRVRGTGNSFIFQDNLNNTRAAITTQGGGGVTYFANGGGSVVIGSTTAGARLDVRAQGALSTDIAFRVRNSADTANLIEVNGAGGVSINSTTQGFLPPRMTNAQRLAIASPAVGLIVYCTDATEGLYENTSTGWVNLNSNKPLQVTPVTLLVAGWTLVSGLYEYEYTNAIITATSVVDVIPNNASVTTVQEAEIYPQTTTTTSILKIFAKNEPTADITVTLNIFL
jgi:hypothetical protein